MTATLRPVRIGWMVLLLVVTGAVLRSLRLSWQPLWWDEGYSVYFATEPLVRMLDLTAGDIHPPLYYALLHGWIGLGSNAAPAALRTFSVIVGVAALPLQAWLTWQLFPGRRRLLIIAMLLLVVNPMHLFYSQEVRMYGLGMALSLMSTACFWGWQGETPHGVCGRRWAAIGYILATTAGLYTLYYFVFVPAAHLLWAVVVHRHRWRRLGPLIAGQALVVVLYLPWLLYTLPRLVGYVGAKVQSDQDVALDPLRYVLRHWAAFTGGHVTWPETTLPWALLLSGAAVAVIGVALFVARRSPPAPDALGLEEKTPAHQPLGRAPLVLLSILVGVAFVGGWLVSLRFPFFPEGSERLLIFTLPYVILLLSVGIDHTWRVAYAGPVALTLLLAAAIGGVFTFYTTPRYVTEDYRSLLRQIVQQGRNEDTLLAIFPWQVGYWRAYTPQGDPALTGPAPVLLSDSAVTWSPAVQSVIDRALTTGTLWFPAPLTFGSTLPGEIETYLAAHAANLENHWYGGTRLTAWANLPRPAVQATAADFGAVQLLQAATAPSSVAATNQPVAVTLTWQVATPADYSISLRLLDAEGYAWSSRDYAAAWATMAPGRVVTERVGLIVPVGLPPGVYTVGVSVAHQDAQGLSGDALTLAGSDTVDAPIGVLTVVAPEAAAPVARLPIRTPLARPVTQASVTFLGFTGPAADTPILAGTELGVTLFLRAETDTPAARDLYVSLLDAQGAGAAGYTGWPLPAYPVNVLTQGELLRVPVRFDTPGALTSGDYRLVAGFYDPATDARTPPAMLGVVRIHQRRGVFSRPMPAVSLPAPVQFGTHARLYGYTLTSAANNVVTLHLYWEIMQPLLPPHHIFVHADAPDGVTLAQQDGPPVTASGPAPTGSWQPGEFLITEHVLSLPADATLRVGLYDPVSLQRLPVTIAGSAAGDSVALDIPG